MLVVGFMVCFHQWDVHCSVEVGGFVSVVVINYVVMNEVVMVLSMNEMGLFCFQMIFISTSLT